jgi:hypothetical protein
MNCVGDKMGTPSLTCNGTSLFCTLGLKYPTLDSMFGMLKLDDFQAFTTPV